MADLVIGADGIGSVVRGAVSGPDARPHYVGYATWRGLVPEGEVPPSGGCPAVRNASPFYDAPGSHVLGYLVPGADGSTEVGRRRYNWVWYRPYSPRELDRVLVDAEGAKHPFSLGPGQVPAELADELRSDAAETLPASFAAAVAAEPRPFLSMRSSIMRPAQMVKGRVALLGDAAFVARPHTAMGVAKAAGDAFALRDALPTACDLDSALRAYEAARVPVGQSIVAYGQRLGRQLELDAA